MNSVCLCMYRCMETRHWCQVSSSIIPTLFPDWYVYWTRSSQTGSIGWPVSSEMCLVLPLPSAGITAKVPSYQIPELRSLCLLSKASVHMFTYWAISSAPKVAILLNSLCVLKFLNLLLHIEFNKSWRSKSGLGKYFVNELQPQPLNKFKIQNLLIWIYMCVRYTCICICIVTCVTTSVQVYIPQVSAVARGTE